MKPAGDWGCPECIKEAKKENEKAKIGDQVVFDYSASVDGNKFEGSEGKGVQMELGKDLFLKGFDEQLVGVKKKDIKNLDAVLPANHPKKELANKKTKFECKILNVKKAKENKIDDNFAKTLGAKNLSDLKKLIEDQWERTPNTVGVLSEENTDRFVYMHEGYKIEAVRTVKLSVKKCT